MNIRYATRHRVAAEQLLRARVIKQRVCSHYGISELAVDRPGRSAKIVEVRHVGMYLVRQLCPALTGSDVSALFNRRSNIAYHATYSVRDYIAVYPAFRDAVQHFEHALRTELGIPASESRPLTGRQTALAFTPATLAEAS